MAAPDLSMMCINLDGFQPPAGLVGLRGTVTAVAEGSVTPRSITGSPVAAPTRWCSPLRRRSECADRGQPVLRRRAVPGGRARWAGADLRCQRPGRPGARGAVPRSGSPPESLTVSRLRARSPRATGLVACSDAPRHRHRRYVHRRRHLRRRLGRGHRQSEGADHAPRPVHRCLRGDRCGAGGGVHATGTHRVGVAVDHLGDQCLSRGQGSSQSTR